MKKTITNYMLLVLSILSLSAQAGTITGGSYLTNTHANQLETWLGVGDQDFTNIYVGTLGSTASTFHSHVDGQGPTFSIYDINYNGQQMYVGGYTSADWGGAIGYATDTSAFLFNLTNLNMLSANGTNNNLNNIYRAPSYFSTFGGGHDLFGGVNSLGGQSEYTNGFSYGTPGTVAGQPGHVTNLITGTQYPSYVNNRTFYQLNGFQVYTIADASVVPLPAAVWLMGSCLLGLVGFSRRRVQVAG